MEILVVLGFFALIILIVHLAIKGAGIAGEAQRETDRVIRERQKTQPPKGTPAAPGEPAPFPVHVPFMPDVKGILTRAFRTAFVRAVTLLTAGLFLWRAGYDRSSPDLWDTRYWGDFDTFNRVTYFLATVSEVLFIVSGLAAVLIGLTWVLRAKA